jgi:hypothetical protein
MQMLIFEAQLATNVVVQLHPTAGGEKKLGPRLMLMLPTDAV